MSEARALFFATAAEPDLHQPWVKEAIDELRSMGVVSVEEWTMDEPFNASSFDSHDIVFVNGGNTFYLLKKMRNAQFAQAVEAFVNRGGLYVGVSAGSIVAGPSIDVAACKTAGDSNNVGLANLAALNLVNTAIYPHFRPEQQTEVNEFQATVAYPVVALKDGEALLVQNESIERV